MDLTVIVVSWNTAPLLAGCLRAIPEAAGELIHRIIVVDNGSSDGTAELVARDFPHVRLIRNASNVGFAKGNNQGMREPESQGTRYVLLLNSDTFPDPGSLSSLVKFLDQHVDAGAVGPKLVSGDGIPQAYAFGRDPSPEYLLIRMAKRFFLHRSMHDWATDTIQEVDWVSGACLMVRRQAIDQIGLLDENFFMFFEDNDWCVRMRKQGWKIYFNPWVSVLHYGGQGLAQAPSAYKSYYHSLNHFYEKHYGRLARLLLRVGYGVFLKGHGDG